MNTESRTTVKSCSNPACSAVPLHSQLGLFPSPCLPVMFSCWFRLRCFLRCEEFARLNPSRSRSVSRLGFLHYQASNRPYVRSCSDSRHSAVSAPTRHHLFL